MRYRTLIFDLDGTISDPFVGLSASINHALRANQFDAVDPERIRPLIGPPLHVIFPTLVGPVGGDLLTRLIEDYREHYGAVGYAENSLYAEMPETIHGLSEKGFTLGICTAKREDYARKIVAMFGLDHHFAFVDGGAGMSKIDQLARILKSGIDAESAVMIGDRDADLLAASNNNLHSVGVLWGFGDRDELEAAQPDYLVESPGELRAIFG